MQKKYVDSDDIDNNVGNTCVRMCIMYILHALCFFKTEPNKFDGCRLDCAISVNLEKHYWVIRFPMNGGHWAVILFWWFIIVEERMLKFRFNWRRGILYILKIIVLRIRTGIWRNNVSIILSDDKCISENPEKICPFRSSIAKWDSLLPMPTRCCCV